MRVNKQIKDTNEKPLLPSLHIDTVSPTPGVSEFINDILRNVVFKRLGNKSPITERGIFEEEESNMFDGNVSSGNKRETGKDIRPQLSVQFTKTIPNRDTEVSLE